MSSRLDVSGDTGERETRWQSAPPNLRADARSYYMPPLRGSYGLDVFFVRAHARLRADARSYYMPPLRG